MTEDGVTSNGVLGVVESIPTFHYAVTSASSFLFVIPSFVIRHSPFVIRQDGGKEVANFGWDQTCRCLRFRTHAHPCPRPRNPAHRPGDQRRAKAHCTAFGVRARRAVPGLHPTPEGDSRGQAL